MHTLFEATHAIMQEASELGRKLAKQPIEQKHKTDGSPVTNADLAINAFLKSKLLALPLHANWLSEEDEKPEFIHPYTWVIDPIDGTRGFIKGLDEWTISVALVHEARPIIAFLARPITHGMYRAKLGEGAFLGRNALKIKPVTRLRGLTFSGPMPLLKRYEASGAILYPRIHSLALRLAFVANNKLNGGFASSAAHDWDIAAADLIVCEAGGLLLNAQKEKPRYLHANFKHGELIAGHETLFDLIG